MKTSLFNYCAQSTLAEAKARLNIHALWHHFRFPGRPASSCRAPWREDHHASFSVNPDGTLWNDFATSEAGDAVDFFQRASGLSKRDACRKFIQLACGQPGNWTSPSPIRHRRAQTKPRPVFPAFRKGTPADFTQLAKLRQIPREALEWAGYRGLLCFGTLYDFPAWVVTDAAKLNAQARRMDGHPWEHIGGKKAWTLPGSWALWPIGICEARAFPAIALCEGGPDLLAAHYIALWERGRAAGGCAPVAMLGAAMSIHAEALPHFSGKKVRIFGHADAAGREAVERWARQLVAVGAEVDAFNFNGLIRTDGQPVNDLNDALLMDAASLTQAERILP